MECLLINLGKKFDHKSSTQKDLWMSDRKTFTSFIYSLSQSMYTQNKSNVRIAPQVSFIASSFDHATGTTEIWDNLVCPCLHICTVYTVTGLQHLLFMAQRWWPPCQAAANRNQSLRPYPLLYWYQQVGRLLGFGRLHLGTIPTQSYIISLFTLDSAPSSCRK